MTTVLERLGAMGVVPGVVLGDAAHAEPLGDALAAGGLPCAEVTFRTAAGEAALETLAARGDLLVGAGTVLTAEQVDRAVDSGAAFIVSPGLSAEVVQRAQERGVTALPGTATASEVQAAVNLGLEVVKLFPARLLGGTDMIDALSGPFPGMRFMPSGGVTLATAGDYLRHPAVMAVGGSWMVPRALIAAGDFDAILALTEETVSVLARGAPR